MPDHPTFHSSIRTKFETEVEQIYTDGSYVLDGKVQYDNAPFDKPENEKWVHLMIVESSSLQASMGGDTNRDRTRGTVMAVTFGPLNVGDGAQLALAQFIKNDFRKTEFECVVFQMPEITPIGRFKNWWQINVACPFYVDDDS